MKYLADALKNLHLIPRTPSPPPRSGLMTREEIIADIKEIGCVNPPSSHKPTHIQC